MSKPNFAIIELNSQLDILANLQAIEQGVALAAKHQADCVVLPENAFCFGNQAYVAQFFEPLKNWCSQLARSYEVHVLAGTLPCPFRADGSKVTQGKFRQSSLLVDPAGDIVARYDKIHLFKATVNDSTANYDESKTFEAGDTPVVAKTTLGNIGMMVCFDIRFPSLALNLRQMRADILTAPSAFTYQTGKAHWHSLLTARALDSQCLIIGAGQTGKHYVSLGKNTPLHDTKTDYRETWGHSQFVNANGEVQKSAIELPYQVDFDNQSELITAAKSFLPISTSIDYLPSHNRVILSNFDKDKQLDCRQAIDLMASQRINFEPSTEDL